MKRFAFVGTLGSLLVAGNADGQVVRGLLWDAETGAPVGGGALTLRNAADSAVARTLADERGEFALRAPAEGTYRLAGDRIGYGTASGTIALQEGIVVDVVFRLSVDAVLLDPITVEATRRITPGSVLHAERRERGLGVFLSQEDVLARTDQDVRDALRDVEGFRVGRGRNGVDCGLGRGRGAGTGFDLVDILPRPYQVSAVELYWTYQEVPDELERWAWTGARPCGVVAVWTHAAW